jgi:Tfp pilus assembly protein PilN
MAIEIVPKRVAQDSLVERIFLYLSVVLLLVSIVGYLSTEYYFIKKAKEESQRLDEALSQAKTDERKKLENELLALKERIDIFSSLVEKHKRNSKVFYFIEDVTHRQVFFSKIGLDFQGDNINLSGETENFQILGEQLIIFKNTEFIRTVRLIDVELTRDGKVTFRFNISIYPKLLTQ